MICDLWAGRGGIGWKNGWVWVEGCFSCDAVK